MFDIGWMELLLIGVVALIVVGPKDLPVLFRTVGRLMGKARGMAREFQRSMEQAADDSGLKDVSRDLNSINRLNLNSAKGSAKGYAERMVKDAGKGRDAEPGGEGAAGRAGTGRAGPAPAAEPPAPAPAPAAPGAEAVPAGPPTPEEPGRS